MFAVKCRLMCVVVRCSLFGVCCSRIAIRCSLLAGCGPLLVWLMFAVWLLLCCLLCVRYGRCVLLVVRWLLFADCCLLCVACWLSFAIRCVLFVGCWLLLLRCALFVGCFLVVVCGLWFVACMCGG